MKKITTTLAVFALVASSQAGFTLVDDMESGGYGTTWTTNGVGSGGFVADPADAGNIVLEGVGADGGQQNFFRTIPTIASNTTATLFMRVRTTVNGIGSADWVFGASDQVDPLDISGPNGWNAYEGYGRLSTGAVTGTDLAMDVRNTGAPGSFSEVGVASPDTWYNVWLVLDNAANTTDMYFNTGGDATSGGTLSVMDANFRRGDGGDLITLFVRNNRVDGVGYLDDVYIDLEGENLINPIPEPGTLGLVAVFGGGVLFIRRRFMI